MAESGVAIDHVTLYRWVQRYAPFMKSSSSVPWLEPLLCAERWAV